MLKWILGNSTAIKGVPAVRAPVPVIVAPGSNNGQPFLKVSFNPNEQIGHGSIRYSGAIRLTPRGFKNGGNLSLSSFKGLLLDISDSMNDAGQNKLQDMKAGAKEALRCSVTADDWFIIIGFNDAKHFIYPRNGKPVRGTADHIALALQAIDAIQASSDTYLSLGIKAMIDAFNSVDCEEGTVALISDGKNNDADKRALRSQLRRIVAFRQADKTLKIQPIGVGPEIKQGVALEQLNQIYKACLADPVRYIEPNTGSQVWGDLFIQIFNDLTNKKLRSVTLRFFDMASTTKVLSIKQARPIPYDFMDPDNDCMTRGGDGAWVEVQMGGWDEGSHLISFELEVHKPAASNGIEAARLQVTYKVGRSLVGTEPESINVRWTSVPDLIMMTPPDLEEARGVLGSVDAISAAVAALQRGDKEEAERYFQKAYDLARAPDVNDQAFIKALGSFVEIDPDTHKVRAKAITVSDSLLLLNASNVRPADEEEELDASPGT